MAKETTKAATAQPEPPESVEYFPPNTAQGVMANYVRSRQNSTAYKLKQIARKNPEVAALLKSK
jgi:hypothetical protein